MKSKVGCVVLVILAVSCVWSTALGALVFGDAEVLVSPTIAASQGRMDQGQFMNLTSSAPVGGVAPYSYQWLSQPPGFNDFSPINGATSSTCSLGSAGAALGGWNFELQTTDAAGSTVTSNVVALIVNSALVAPDIYVSPMSSYVQWYPTLGEMDQGQTADVYTHTLIPSGTRPVAFQWLIEAPGASSYSPISGATSNSYWFAPTSSSATGDWSFQIQESDSAGVTVTSNAVTVTVNLPQPSPTPFPAQTLSQWPMMVGNVTVGNEPYTEAYDSGKAEMFVVNSGDDSVSVISDKNNTVIATIPVMPFPAGIAYDPSKGEVFVANSGWNTVSVISDASNTVVANITVGDTSTTKFVTGPTGIAYDSAKGWLYVATSYEENEVSVISDSSNTVIATIQVGNFPSWVAYDSGKGEIFVTNSYDNTTSVISDATNKVIATIPVGWTPKRLAYDSAMGEIFVCNSAGNTLSVISDANNTVTATIPVGLSPADVAFDSAKNEIFVTNSGSNSVSVIADRNNTVVSSVAAGKEPQGIAYDQGKGELFVTNYWYLPSVMFFSISKSVLIFSDAPPLSAPHLALTSDTVTKGQNSISISASVDTGISPYTYQWFVEDPNATAYSAINNATEATYKFTATASTMVGNWAFILQVTDATGTAVNSTATTVMVDPAASQSLMSSNLTLTAVALVGAAVVIGAVAVALKKHKSSNANL